MRRDDDKSHADLLYELRLLRLENMQLREVVAHGNQDFASRRQLRYLENVARIDKTIRQSRNLEEMMSHLMDDVRSIFQCDQAWLLHPCDPDADSWRVPFRSVSEDHPIHFGPDEDLPVTPDLAENCRLALKTDHPMPLGPVNKVKDIPTEAKDSSAKSALLIALHPKSRRPWLMGLHQCDEEREWTAEEKRLYQDISSRITNALSNTLFYRDIENNQDRLKHLSAQLFRTQEEERKRVAEEIHDELGQAALAIKMGVENTLYLIEDAPEPARRSLQSAANLSKGIVEKMRRMQRSLYPPTLRDFGAVTALNGFLEDFINIYALDVKRDIRISNDAIPEAIRVTLFRLAQEALYNTGKHSQASRVSVALEQISEKLILEIVDDGIGFDPENVLKYPDVRLGLGLTSMRERAEISGGALDIISEPGKGTVIRCVWSETPDESDLPA